MLLNMFVPLFLTIILGQLLAKVRIRGSTLGSAMMLFVGIFISWLYGVYAYSLPEGHPDQQTAVSLMESSIVPNSVLNIFLMFFISGVGLIASKELIPVLKRYGLKFLALAILTTTIGMAGTFSIGILAGGFSAYEMAGVFSGALSSTPGMTAGLSSAESHAETELDSFDSLNENIKERIVAITGEPENGAFTEEQRSAYQKYTQTAVGIGYTITFPFGNLLVLICINLFPMLFRIDIKREREAYEKEMDVSSKITSENKALPPSFSMAAFFLVLLAGYLLGSVKIGSFSLSATGGVLIASLVLGSIGSIPGFNFHFDSTVLRAFRDMGMSGVLSATGLRLGYNVVTAVTGSQAMLAVYSIIIGVVAMLCGFLIGKYLLKMNWMVLSGSICGAMTNTSGLGVAVDAAGCDYPSIGYAATYPFAVVMMVIYTMFIQRFPF